MVHLQWYGTTNYITSWAKLMQTNPKQFSVYHFSTYITEHSVCFLNCNTLVNSKLNNIYLCLRIEYLQVYYNWFSD